jgi:uncharacterized protein YhfF
MSPASRHGLRTLLVTAVPDVPDHLARHLLSGSKTVVLRPVPDGVLASPERAGERVLLIDGTGRPLAVADVTAASLTRLADVDEPTRRADDPDHVSAEQWVAAQLARWIAAGLVDADATSSLPVMTVHLHVVGLETDQD